MSWVECPAGRHWGTFGAAGLAIVAPGPLLLVLHRALGSHHGGSWGLPGGALDEGESAQDGALREAAEEVAGFDPELLELISSYQDRCPADCGWSYTTWLARTPAPFPARPGNWEHTDYAWTDPDATELALLPALAAAIPRWRIHREI
jgi:8-oxo-dGTP pyrophosphatase MutT (NUDIX family)